MDLKSIKLAQLKLKCRDLNLKEYGSKLLVFERIKKHYIDNSLGEFNLDELVELEHRCRQSSSHILLTWND
jgi:hypothetical protein